MKRVVIFDCDVLAYRAAAACEERKIKVLHKKSGRTRLFKNRTAFKDFLKEAEIEYVEDKYEITDLQLAEDVSHALSIVKNQIKNIEDDLWVTESKFFISGMHNFRDELKLPVKYKSSRAEMLRPVLLKDVRNYLISKYKAVVVHGCETDDALVYEGYKYLNNGYDVIICTNDKDANAYSGLSLYNYTNENPQIITIPDLGYVEYDKEKRKAKGLGFLWYCCQLLTGDVTDCFKPTDLCDAKFGDKGAVDLLKDCKTHQEALIKCIEQYKKWYPEPITYQAWDGTVVKDANWQYLLNMYHGCCRMKETEDDPLIAFDFFRKYGVNLNDY